VIALSIKPNTLFSLLLHLLRVKDCYSVAGQIFTPRRARIFDENFENIYLYYEGVYEIQESEKV